MAFHFDRYKSVPNQIYGNEMDSVYCYREKLRLCSDIKPIFGLVPWQICLLVSSCEDQ